MSRTSVTLHGDQPVSTLNGELRRAPLHHDLDHHKTVMTPLLTRISHRTRLGMLVLTGSILGSIACAPQRPSDQTRITSEAPQERAQRPVAMVGGHAVSAADFENYIKALPASSRARYSALTRRQELLQSVVFFEAMADDAELKRLDARKAGRDHVLHELHNTLAQRTLEARWRDERVYDVSPDALRAAYTSTHPALPAGTTTRQVIGFKASTRTLADTIRTLAMEPDTPMARLNRLRMLASRYSSYALTRTRGGELGRWSSSVTERDPNAEQLRTLAFSLDPMQISAPTKVDDAWWLVTSLNPKPQTRASLASVERELRQSLIDTSKATSRRALLATLRAEAAAEVSKRTDAIATLKKPNMLDNSP